MYEAQEDVRFLRKNLLWSTHLCTAKYVRVMHQDHVYVAG